MKKVTLILAFGVLVVIIAVQGVVLWGHDTATTPTTAGTQSGAPVPLATVRKRLEQFGGAAAQALEYKPQLGLYQARFGTHIAYITPDGQYLLSGNLYSLASHQNLTANAQARGRKALLDKINPNSAITFKPKGHIKHVVWVFTDVTCPYCRKFHSQINQYLAHGIEVRYLSYPRTGPGSQSWKLAEEVWCSSTPKQAITRAKANQPLTHAKVCKNNPVARDYRLGQEMGLRGTPMIIATDGQVMGGYVPPDTLAARLDKLGS